MRNILAVSAALRWELRPLLRAFAPVRRLAGRRPATWCTRSDPPVLIFQTGVGIDAACGATASVLSAFPVAAVINTGSAGALAPGIGVGSVVVATAVVQPPPDPAYRTDDLLTAELSKAAENLGADSRAPQRGWPTHRLARQDPVGGCQSLRQPILSNPFALGTAAAKREAYARYATVAVEMEGAGVARAAREHGVRFASARVILDRADQDLPAIGVNRPQATASPARTLANLARPAALVRAGELHAATRVAADLLERLFAAFLAQRGCRGWFDDGP
jgi:adenosylhomocysteine nucleosidase